MTGALATLRATSPIGPGRLVAVVGPSGAGKDTLIAGARAAFRDEKAVVFPRRVITRPPTDSEDNGTLKDAAFDRAVENGLFAFWWQAHGLKYGIPRIIEDDIRAGRVIVCNVSRAIVNELRTKYACVEVVLVTAPADVLATRLVGRARESDRLIMQRIKRRIPLADLAADHTIENTGTVESAVDTLLAVIRRRP